MPGRAAGVRAFLRAAALLLAAGAAAAVGAVTTPSSLAHAEASAPPPAALEPRPALSNATPTQLFAAVEEAWSTGDAEALAALVDTTSVRIGLKPGTQPTAAITRSSAAFLFQDQLRLVTTRSFQVLSLNVGKTTATATAQWTGDWGGRQGMRRLTVRMRAAPVSGGWVLREVRVKG
jgi:hypothetical protein